MVFETILKRRSVRNFTKDPVEAQKTEQILQAALLSPTSKNRYPWEFVAVTDKHLITQLAESKEHGSQFAASAPLAVVVTADPSLSDVWIEDCSIAAYSIQLVAEENGLGSCWIQIRNRKTKEGRNAEDYVKKVCSIPPDFRIDSIIAIGYPQEKKKPHSPEETKQEKIHYNRF